MILPWIAACGVIAALLLLYRSLRIRQWRRILKESVEYHRYHLSSISGDPSAGQASREMAQSMLWSVNRQLPLDMKDGNGMRALINSFRGRKTSLNTCGTVFYECVKNHRVMDQEIFKLANTLISTLCRIFILESSASVIGLLYNDINLAVYLFTGSGSGTGRFYYNMKKEINREKPGS